MNKLKQWLEEDKTRLALIGYAMHNGVMKWMVRLQDPKEGSTTLGRHQPSYRLAYHEDVEVAIDKAINHEQY